MACQYVLPIPSQFSDNIGTLGLKIASAVYTENGQSINYDLTALDSCTDFQCVEVQIATAFPPLSGSWDWDSFSQTLGGATINEHLTSVTIVNVNGDTAVVNATETLCETGTGTVSTTDTGFSQEGIFTISEVEVAISFFVLLFSFIYGITKT